MDDELTRRWWWRLLLKPEFSLIEVILLAIAAIMVWSTL
jgi:hypothetical protein